MENLSDSMKLAVISHMKKNGKIMELMDAVVSGDKEKLDAINIVILDIIQKIEMDFILKLK